MKINVWILFILIISICDIRTVRLKKETESIFNEISKRDNINEYSFKVKSSSLTKNGNNSQNEFRNKLQSSVKTIFEKLSAQFNNKIESLESKIQENNLNHSKQIDQLKGNLSNLVRFNAELIDNIEKNQNFLIFLEKQEKITEKEMQEYRQQFENEKKQTEYLLVRQFSKYNKERLKEIKTRSNQTYDKQKQIDDLKIINSLSVNSEDSYLSIGDKTLSWGDLLRSIQLSDTLRKKCGDEMQKCFPYHLRKK